MNSTIKVAFVCVMNTHSNALPILSNNDIFVAVAAAAIAAVAAAAANVIGICVTLYCNGSN